MLEPSSSVLFVHSGGNDPGKPRAVCPADGDQDEPRAVDLADGDLAELTVAFPGQRPEGRTDGDASVTRVIVVGDVLQSAAGSLPECSVAVAVEAIPDPTDLGAIGVSVSRFCDRWAGVDRIVVSVRSLERLLRLASPEKGFRFLHALLARLEQVGATTYASVDRSRFDDHLVATVGTLFDEVVVDDATESLPEASDRDVAEVFSTPTPGDPLEAPPTSGSISEATDEELARHLENYRSH